MSNENNGGSKTSVVDFSSINLPPVDANPFGAETKGKDGQTRKVNKVWLNVGVVLEVPLPDGKGGTEIKQIMLQLPKGIALDDMVPDEIPRDKDGKNPIFKMQKTAEVKLTNDVIAVRDAMKEGERVILKGFTAELYHIEKKEQLANQNLDQNIFLAALNSKK